MLFAFALMISSRSETVFPALQLFDRIRTFVPVAAAAWIANSIALTAFATVPTPVPSRNFTPIIRVVQFTPAMPILLLPTAPMVPATCVPWPKSSIGSQLFRMALKPWEPAGQLIVLPAIVTENGAGAAQMFGARSLCV